MKLKSPHKSPERILAYGGPGAGKTFGWMQIAKATTGHFYVIDTDQTVLPYLESEEFAELEGRITYVEPWDWSEYIDFLKEHRSAIKPGDWMVVDMMSEPWNEVQRYFVDQVWGEEEGDFWLKYAKQVNQNDGGSKTPFDGMVDWQAIKKLYKRFQMALLKQPGHLYLATGEKQLHHHDSSATKRTYERYGNGFKPDGEKTLGHIVRTVLRFTNQRFTTVKDRQREYHQGKKIDNFARDYLRDVAGWKVDVEATKEAA